MKLDALVAIARLHWSTIYPKPNPYRLGFILPGTPVLARFRAVPS
jgi:hypothetical protein